MPTFSPIRLRFALSLIRARNGWERMASNTDSTLVFFTKATPVQWSYMYSQYKAALKAKASKRTKKGGPEELIRMDDWYQEQLPKQILSRKEPHITHDELLQITRWKLMRGRYRPNLIDLVRINTEKAVVVNSKKAFQRLPNLSGAVGALTCLKGVGPATASAILAAGFPEHAPYMADECMISTPGVETLDYTIAEYLNYAMQLKKRSDQLNKLDPAAKWDPHKVELALWTHFVSSEMCQEILTNLPLTDDVPKDSDEGEEKKENSEEKDEKGENKARTLEDEDSVDSFGNRSSNDGVLSEDSNSQTSFGKNGQDSETEPPAKKSRV